MELERLVTMDYDVLNSTHTRKELNRELDYLRRELKSNGLEKVIEKGSNERDRSSSLKQVSIKSVIEARSRS